MTTTTSTTTTTQRRTARRTTTARTPRRGLDALLAAALSPLVVDLSGMSWESDRDETWM
jgi:hypothetical protein